MIETQPFLRLTYISTARVPMEVEFVSRISQVKAVHDVNGVGGVLIYNGLNFIETLEGPAGAVERAFEQASTETYHSGVRVIDRSLDAERLFDTWTFIDAEALHGLAPPLTQRPLPETLDRAYRAVIALAAR